MKGDEVTKARLKLRKERLAKLVQHLLTLPPTVTFDMNEWASHTKDHKPTAGNYCGTTACVLGHAATIPQFQRAGLKLTWKRDSDGGWEGLINGKRGRSPVKSGKRFFLLTDEEANQLFLPDYTPSEYGNDIDGKINQIVDFAMREDV